MAILTSRRDRPASRSDILQARIIFAITPVGLQGLEGRALMVRQAPLGLITAAGDGKIDRPVARADASSA